MCERQADRRQHGGHRDAGQTCTERGSTGVHDCHGLIFGWCLPLQVLIFYIVEMLFIRQDILGMPYAFNIFTMLLAPVPYGHLLWTLSTGELRGTGWTEGLTSASKELGGWGIDNDYYYEAQFFVFFDAFFYFGIALLADSVMNDPLSFGRGPKAGESIVPDFRLYHTMPDHFFAPGSTHMHRPCRPQRG